MVEEIIQKDIHLNMHNEVTSSMEIECARRLSNLYEQSHPLLVKIALKVTKQKETAEDVVMELYEYLHKKQNIKLFWGPDSYNIKYCCKFIRHRFLNKTKKLNRITLMEELPDDEIDIPYDYDNDIGIQTAHEEVLRELKNLEATKLWASSRIFELYWMSTDTLDDVSEKIGISKSTTFLAVKKIRKYLKEIIDNPFTDKDV